MRRRSLLVVGLCLLSSTASIRAQQGPRPEALLPDSTIFYVGTDDLTVLVDKSRASPLWKILAEQQMQDFLEKAIGELRRRSTRASPPPSSIPR